MRWNSLCLLVPSTVAMTVTMAATAGCDGRPIEIDPGKPVGGDVLAVLLGDGRGCPEVRPTEEAEEALRVNPNPSFGERLAIVELAFIESCRAMPGQYALARETPGSRTFWFGTDGCHMWDQPPAPNGSHGVIRVAQTAALFTLPPESCISFPGESTIVRSDSISRALVVVKTKDAALRLAEKVLEMK